MSKPSLTLYFDIISPFSYLAYKILSNSPVFSSSQCTVTIVPVFLGAIQARLKNTPPGNIPHKGDYVRFELRHWAERFRIPLAQGFPQPFPQNTLQLMRALTAVTLVCPERFDAVIEACEKAFWMEHRTISKGEVYAPIFTETLGEQLGAKVLGMERNDEVKQLLTQRTEEAFEQKAFGLPWFKAVNAKGETRCFWGISHLGLVIEFLGLDRKLDEGFRAML
nr:isoform 3 of glutathione s-transferase kappa 1 [Quercus suber]